MHCHSKILIHRVIHSTSHKVNTQQKLCYSAFVEICLKVPSRKLHVVKVRNKSFTSTNLESEEKYVFIMEF